MKKEWYFRIIFSCKKYLTLFAYTSILKKSVRFPNVTCGNSVVTAQTGSLMIPSPSALFATVVALSSHRKARATYILILNSFVRRLGQSRADLHFGNRLVHSSGSGKERSMSLNSAAVTSTGTFSRHTSSQPSIFSRSSRTNRAFADFLNMPWVNGPLVNIWCNIACRRKKMINV